MLIENQIKHYVALNQWFKTPLGIVVAKEFSRILAPHVDILTGGTLLQLGHCGENNWLNTLKFNDRWVASPFLVLGKNQLLCAFNNLPFPKKSLDCVIVPLTLEPFGSSLSLLDEIDRVLKPMGFIVFFSLNPWSLWGLAMKCGFLRCYDNNKIKMHTPYLLNRYLMHRGYTQFSLINFCYLPPLNKQSLIKKFIFFEEIGKMLWPFPSGLYCYIAQKSEVISPLFITHSISELELDIMQPSINSL